MESQIASNTVLLSPSFYLKYYASFFIPVDVKSFVQFPQKPAFIWRMK